VFKMAPIHHHFELEAWSETKIMLRFWIVAAACGAIGFTLYQTSRPSKAAATTRAQICQDVSRITAARLTPAQRHQATHVEVIVDASAHSSSPLLKASCATP
jgi:hypothetical protein